MPHGMAAPLKEKAINPCLVLMAEFNTQQSPTLPTSSEHNLRLKRTLFKTSDYTDFPATAHKCPSTRSRALGQPHAGLHQSQ